jgi:2-amino-4-hydroxy-6-hydroxymethyldihydropteridine diphosphokinase
MNIVYLLIGGNLGDRWQNLADCRDLLESQIGEVDMQSRIYETAAWGKVDQNDFLNQVLVIRTMLDPQSVLKKIHSIEQYLGRVRHEHWGERLIDIDILFYNDDIVNSPLLKIPHPQIPFRKFTLTPLMEIAPELVHPLLHKTIWQLYQNCNDKLPVSEYVEY